jgi:hypothetical protein
MSSPRFLPRTYSEQPDLFGKTMLMTWRAVPDEASESAKDQAAASQRQHRFAVAIRDAARAQHGSVKVYSEMVDVNYARLNDLLSGKAIMRFEDVANAERNLGLKL